MRTVQITGVLPSSMAEGSGPGDWSATLNLAGDLTGLTGVELLGRDALAFQASLLPGYGAVFLTPGAPVDYEALVAGGRAPLLDVSLRLHFADGSVVNDPAPRSVTVLDIDDTPPTALAFASGGTVVAGAIGAAIGQLAVTDPDTAGHFTFSFPDDEAWRFEVVGSTLKLRDGISLGLDDMPDRPLIIEVSDGHHSAAFVLNLHVIDPATQLWQLPPEDRAGFTQVDSTTVVALTESRTVAQSEVLADGERVVVMQDSHQVILPAAERVYLADGFQDTGTASTGVQAAAVAQAVTGEAAGGKELAVTVAQAEQGMSWTDIAAASADLTALPAADADAVVALYQNALDRDPSAAELALQAGRLASGVSRAQLAVDLSLGEEGLAHQPHAGVWVADALGEDGAWRAGPGGLSGSAAVGATAAQDPVWLL